MFAIAFLFVRVLCDCFKSRRRLEAEILVLRHQLNVLQQRAPRRLYLTWADRALFDGSRNGINTVRASASIYASALGAYQFALCSFGLDCSNRRLTGALNWYDVRYWPKADKRYAARYFCFLYSSSAWCNATSSSASSCLIFSRCFWSVIVLSISQ